MQKIEFLEIMDLEKLISLEKELQNILEDHIFSIVISLMILGIQVDGAYLKEVIIGIQEEESKTMDYL